MPKISIITGYYNRGDKLERTLESLRLQNYEDYEIIVFDDASTDDTCDRLVAYAEMHPAAPIKLRHHTKNIGFVQGMIEAIADSDSKYIAVQGSGDTAHPDRLRHQAAILDSVPEVVAVGCWYHSVTEISGSRQPRRLNSDDSTFDTLVSSGPPFTHGEVMMRRSAYESAGGYRSAFTFCQDYDLWLRMIQIGEFRTVPKYLYDRYTLSDGVSYKPSKRALQERYALLARLLATCPKNEVASTLKRLETEGPEALVPLEHPELQKRMFRAAVASIAWENTDAARSITRDYLVGFRRQQTARAVQVLCNNAAGRRLLKKLASGQ
ncbi:glycosyltransferase family 2 protein [Limimaricola cinnabarinus]|uniref:glycosyltransferase family 2 protein n=1 Tax=Limimaricola cinnabarinus TaxID=1125964 RepID=UPI002FDF1D2E